MKTIFISLYGVFMLTAFVTHIWTVIIAYSEAGFLGAIITLIIPFLSEVFWMFKMFGENNFYAYTALIHIILAIPFSSFGRSNN